MKLPRLITSAQNSKIKLLNRLRTKRGRQEEARFVIDHQRDLQRARQQGYEIDFLLYSPQQVDSAALPPGQAFALAPKLLERVSYRQNPDGLVAVMHSKPPQGPDALQRHAIASALVLIDLRVPGNIGALLRSADAADMDAIMLVDSALDVYNPNIIRSSTGACFRNRIFHLNAEQLLAWLNAAKPQVIAGDVAGEKRLYDIEFRQPTAILLGAEDQGLGQRWLDVADIRASIPMAGRVCDSLNVSVSGAIFMYEFFRQRQLRLERSVFLQTQTRDRD